MHEFEFIRSLLAPLAADKGAAGLGDDAALVAPPAGCAFVITTDALVQNVHFTGGESPDLIARKLLRVNLSDLAAMGASPYGYFLALMLPASADHAWLKAFAGGLATDQQAFGLTLLGGDTTRHPAHLTLSVTMLGIVPEGEALMRSGASAGEDIYVSGTIGDGALGLQAAQGGLNDAFLLGRYQLPEPRVALGQRLRGVATACMDISDGLMQDLGHICDRSQLGAVVKYASVPLSVAARTLLSSCVNPHETVLAGGDDYELLFTAKPEAAERISALSVELSLPITRIGRMEKGNEARALDVNGNLISLERKGYRHF